MKSTKGHGREAAGTFGCGRVDHVERECQEWKTVAKETPNYADVVSSEPLVEPKSQQRDYFLFVASHDDDPDIEAKRRKKWTTRKRNRWDKKERNKKKVYQHQTRRLIRGERPIGTA